MLSADIVNDSFRSSVLHYVWYFSNKYSAGNTMSVSVLEFSLLYLTPSLALVFYTSAKPLRKSSVTLIWKAILFIQHDIFYHFFLQRVVIFSQNRIKICVVSLSSINFHAHNNLLMVLSWLAERMWSQYYENEGC